MTVRGWMDRGAEALENREREAEEKRVGSGSSKSAGNWKKNAKC